MTFSKDIRSLPFPLLFSPSLLSGKYGGGSEIKNMACLLKREAGLCFRYCVQFVLSLMLAYLDSWRWSHSFLSSRPSLPEKYDFLISSHKGLFSFLGGRGGGQLEMTWDGFSFPLLFPKMQSRPSRFIFPFLKRPSPPSSSHCRFQAATLKIFLSTGEEDDELVFKY